MGDEIDINERTILKLQRDIARLTQERDKLREALAPFARFVQRDLQVPPGLPFTRADCEHAMLVLAGGA